MCGIFGTTRRYERSVVEHKLELMNFRGPDHTGVEEIQTPDGEKLTFGHVRLSIIDLTLAATNRLCIMTISASSSTVRCTTTLN